MYRIQSVAFLASALACGIAVSIGGAQSSDSVAYWPQWRGPLQTGEAPLADPPLRWDERTHVRWKAAIPGRGHATPVVWGDRIFVQTAVPVRGGSGWRQGPGSEGVYQFDILCLDRAEGKILWRRTARTEAPHEGRHEDGSWASGSPMTDGEHVFAWFGSRGLYCYDMQGTLRWQKDFGDMHIRYGWGEGNSPALHGSRLIVQWDHEGDSFVAALDKRTGRELWRANRNEGTSWATPLVVEHEGVAQVVASAIRSVRGYNLETGALLWETRGMTANPIPSPVAGGGIVYLTGGYRESILQAISLRAARGDAVRSRAILWEYHQDTPYVPSPLLYGGALYFLRSNQNILTCLDARTGTPFYTRQRLDGIDGVYASPVAARGRVYIVGRNGTTLVLRHGPKYEVLASNTLSDRFDASPVIVGTELYLRGHSSIYCLN